MPQPYSYLQARTARGHRGGYRLRDGLRRWYDATGDRWKSVGGVGGGGCDVLFLGDSINEGAIATNYMFDRASHLLKVMLQNRFNPPGVTGGYGLVPALTGFPTTWTGVTSDLWTFGGTWTKTDNASSGVGCRQCSAAANDTTYNRARFVFDGTDSQATFKRSGVSRLELVYGKGSSGGTIRWDLNGTDAFVTPGSGSIASGTINTNQGSPSFGERSGVPSTTLTTSNLNVIQVASPASTGSVFLEGAIAYNGDYDCGVRVHNLSNWGTTIGTWTNTGVMSASINRWATGAGGATNAKLFIINNITNDVSADKTAFKTSAQTIITRILTTTSTTPCILWVIPPRPSQTLATSQFTNYPVQARAVYELADENQNMGVFDCQAAIDTDVPYSGTDTYNGIVTTLGWNEATGVHYTNKFQVWLAEKLYGILSAAA